MVDVKKGLIFVMHILLLVNLTQVSSFMFTVSTVNQFNFAMTAIFCLLTYGTLIWLRDGPLMIVGGPRAKPKKNILPAMSLGKNLNGKSLPEPLPPTIINGPSLRPFSRGGGVWGGSLGPPDLLPPPVHEFMKNIPPPIRNAVRRVSKGDSH